MINQPERKGDDKIERQKETSLPQSKYRRKISPTHKLRPVVRGQTSRYNMKQKLGRGFTLKELLSGGVHGQNYARSLGIAVDTRYN